MAGSQGPASPPDALLTTPEAARYCLFACAIRAPRNASMSDVDSPRVYTAIMRDDSDDDAGPAEARHFLIFSEVDGSRKWVIVGQAPLTIGPGRHRRPRQRHIAHALPRRADRR
jgi:hypothetical protein